MKRLFPIFVALVVGLVTLPSTTAAAATAPPTPTWSGPTKISEGKDWATVTWSDPWDFDNEEDLLLDAAGPALNVTNRSRSGGKVKFRLNEAGYVSPLWGGYPGALPFGRDGVINKVQASGYDRVSFALKSTKQVPGGFFWFQCQEIVLSCAGGRAFTVRSGWKVYDMPLTPNLGSANRPWSGTMSGLRLALSPSTATDFEIDWIRLYKSGSGVCLTSAGADKVVWDTNTSKADNTTGAWGWGELDPTGEPGCPFRFDHEKLPKGGFWFYGVKSGADSGYSSKLSVDGKPLPVIHDPDITGGDDYATVVRGNPWDFSGPADVSSLVGAGSVSWSGGKLHATNAGNLPPGPPPYRNDPHFFLTMGGQPIDPAKYHRLTVKQSYDGAFGLEDAPGGGAHGRLVWTRQNRGSELQQSKELVTYEETDEFSVSLQTEPGKALNEDDIPNKYPWVGSAVTSLRYDPNEDRGSRRWHIDDIRLAADDEAKGNSFDITWSDARHQAGTTVDLFMDSDDEGFDGIPIATDVSQSPGLNTFTWDTTNIPPGRYWIHITSTDPDSSNKAYSSGPVVVPGTTWKPYGSSTAGVWVDAADLDGNSANGDEFVVGPDLGTNPQVKVRRRTGGAFHNFFAYPINGQWNGGVRVALASDSHQAGCGLLATGPGPGSPPLVKVWRACSNGSRTLVFEKNAYTSAFHGGVTVGVGDVTGDGRADLVTGAGPGGGPHVKVWEQLGNGRFSASGSTTPDQAISSFMAYKVGFDGGVNVRMGDPDGGGDNLIASPQTGGGPHVKVWDIAAGTGIRTISHSFMGTSTSFTGGIWVDAGDITSHPGREFVISRNSSAAEIIVKRSNNQFIGRIEPSGMGSGARVAIGDVVSGGTSDLLVGTGKKVPIKVAYWEIDA